MTGLISSELSVEVAPANDHEWDAAVSTWAVLRGMQGRWQRDLHRLPTEPGERLIEPAGETHRYWPH